MKNKILTVLITIFTICSCMFVLTACEENEPPHTHEFNKQVVSDTFKASDATCEKKAKYYYSCSCGEKSTETFESGEGLGHLFANYVYNNDAKCEVDGTETAVCDHGCGADDTRTKTASALEHEYGEPQYVWNNNQCTATRVCLRDNTHIETETGTAIYVKDTDATCLVAEKGHYEATFVNSAFAKQSTAKNSVTNGFALEHSFTNYVYNNDAKCEVDGTETAVCDHGCGEDNTRTKVGSALGHEYNMPFYAWSDNKCLGITTCKKDASHIVSETVVAQYVRDNVATCLKAETGHYQAVFENGIFETQNTAKGSIVIGGAQGHTEVIDSAEEPTCTKAGSTEGKHCSVCQEVLVAQQIINPTGHKYNSVVTDPTCIDSGFTTYTCHCGNSYKDDYVDALGHADGEVVVENNLLPTCTEKGSCDYVVYCTVCSKEVSREHIDIDALEHNYRIVNSNNNGTHNEICKIDNETTRVVDCTYEYVSNNNGTKTGTCACGYEAIFVDEAALIVENGVLQGVTEYGKTLTNLIILDDVKEINKGALFGCVSVQRLTIPFVGRNSSDNNNAYLGYLFGADGPTEENPTHLTAIPTSLTEIIITGKTELGYGALAFLPAVERIEIAEGASVAGYGAFAYNLKLQAVKLPESLTTFVFAAFAFCPELESVELSSKTTIFTEAMFCDCTSLEEVSLPEGLKVIGPSAFARTGIIDVIIPDSVTKIDKYAFIECASLTSVKMSKNATNLGSDIFHRCYSLVDVTIPYGVTTIGERTFYFCNSLESIEIPSSVTSIGSEAFAFCYSLTEIYVPYSVTHISNYAVQYCGGLTIYCERSASEVPSTWDENAGYDAAIVLDCNNNDVAIDGYIYTIVNGVRYRIKDNVATVTKQARWIRKANIQSNITYKGVNYKVTNIEGYAFNYCEKLAEISIPDSVGVDTCAFNNSAYYNDANNWQDGIFYISNKIIGVDNNIFGAVVIRDGVTSIPDGLFRGTNITSIRLPNSVKSIGNEAFAHCYSLTEIILSDNLETVGRIPFTVNLTKGACNEKDGLYYLPSNNNDYFYLLTADRNVEQASIVEGCRLVGAGSLYNCSLVKEIVVPNSVVYIGGEAFYGCNSLESLTIPFLGKQKERIGESTEYVLGFYFGDNRYYGHVGNYEFKDYHYYPSSRYDGYELVFYVPNTLKNVTVLGGEIADYAFYNCKRLECITLGEDITAIGEDAFYSCISLKQVNYLGTVDGWAQIEFANVISNPLNDYDYDGWVDDEWIEKETNLYVDGELVTDVILTSATKISAYAFYNCKSLTSIVIPASVTCIGESAFDACDNLTSVYYTGTIDSWVQIEFKNRWSNPLNYAQYLYVNNELVTDVVITSATKISAYAFVHCKSLTSIVMPESVTSIGEGAFNSCASLKTVTISDGIKVMENDVFANCNSLESIYFGKNIEEIENGAFGSWSSITAVYYGGTANDWDNMIIGDDNANLTNATRYYYVVNEEDLPIDEGRYWHYNESGEIEVWHYHEYDSCVVIAPTCTEKGYSLHTCVCGNSYKDTYVDALGHLEVPHEGKDATCTESGYKAYKTCRRCEYDTYEETLALGHTEVIVDAVAPTCTKNGLTRGVYCSACKEVFEEQKVIDATGHSYDNKVTTAPTCTKQGYTTYTCHCGDSYQDDYVGALGHTEDEGKVENNVQPTCTKDGSYDNVIYCKVCKVELNRETVVVDALGHTEDEGKVENNVQPTCTKDGSYDNVIYCKACKVELNRETVVVDALGHVEVIDSAVESTCTNTGLTEGTHCSVCGAVLVVQEVVELKEHNYEYTVNHYEEMNGFIDSKCSVCGYTYTKIVELTAFTVTQDNRAKIGYAGEENEKLVIPAVFEDDGTWYKITDIAGNAFYDCNLLASVVIPDSVTSIGYEAFSGCSSLTSIAIPDSVISIEDYAFYNCPIEKATMPTLAIPYISKDSLKEVVLTSGESIDDYAFYYCSSLTSVTIGNSVTSIGVWAFYYCSSLTSVTIGNSVTSIGVWAFYNCSSLTSIEIPNSLTSIGEYAFGNCSSLTSIVIPDSVTSINYEAFYDCPIEKATMPILAIPYISKDSLKEVVLTSGERIGDYAFDCCSSLTSIVIPDSVTSIGDYAFYGCSSLTSIKIPASVTSIGDYAFHSCSGLTGIGIPSSVTHIGYEVFSYTYNLIIYCEAESQPSTWDRFWNNWGCTVIWGGYDSEVGCVHVCGEWVSNGDNTHTKTCIYCDKKIILDCYGGQATCTDFAICEGCGESYGEYLDHYYANDHCVMCDRERYTEGLIFSLINGDAEYEVTGYTGVDVEIFIPAVYEGKSVTSIGSSTFYNCDSLTSVVIGDNVTNIGDWAFGNCTSLVGIAIPSSVTSICHNAFYGCSNLTIFCLQASKPENWADTWNGNCQVVWNDDSTKQTKEDMVAFLEGVVNSLHKIIDEDYSYPSDKEFSIPEATGDYEILSTKFGIDQGLIFIQLIADYYKNDSYIITDKFVTVDTSMSITGITNPVPTLITARANVDNQKQILQLQIAYELLIMEGQMALYYLDFEVGYDYLDSSELIVTYLQSKFYTKTFYNGQSVYNYQECSCTNGKFYAILQCDELQLEQAKGVVEEFVSIKETETIKIAGDFDEATTKFYYAGTALEDKYKALFGGGSNPDPNNTTLQDLADNYNDYLIDQAQNNAGDLWGDFYVVVLNAEETKEQLSFYTFPNGIDMDSITGGLFVQFDVYDDNGDYTYTIYYNFALQFSQEQSESIPVTYDGALETWYLDVVEDNRTILFYF